MRKSYQRKGLGSLLWKSIWKAVLDKYMPKNMIVWSVEQSRGFYARFGGKEVAQKSFEPDSANVSYAFVWLL